MTETLTLNFEEDEKKYFFDTYALIELIKNNPTYARFHEETILTGVLNYGEFYYWYLKQKDKLKAVAWMRRIKNDLLKLETRDVVEGMRIRWQDSKKKLSFVDCVGYAMAIRRNMLFVTGDPGFKGMKNVEFVE